VYRSSTVKLINTLVSSFQESMEQERAMNQQITALVNVCMQLVQAQVLQQPPLD
jgi:ferritin